MGRPSKYKKKYCKELIAHMTEGMSYEAFAGKIGVHKDTLYEWEKHHTEFSDAKKEAVARSQYFWEKVGLGGTLGQVKGFNVTAWIFNMKNRFNWRDKKDVEHSGGPIAVTISKDDADL